MHKGFCGARAEGAKGQVSPCPRVVFVFEFVGGHNNPAGPQFPDGPLASQSSNGDF
jgi:hypothetical protein